MSSNCFATLTKVVHLLSCFNIGKEALLKIKDTKPDKQLMMFALKNSTSGNPLLLHDEPIYDEKGIIGRTTSGNYSFNYNKNLAFGYIKTSLSKEELTKQKVFIEVEGKKYQASIILKPLNQKNIKSI